MQLLEITKNTKLSELVKLVGSRNVEQMLAINGLQRVPNIGEAFYAQCYSSNGAQSVQKSGGQSEDQFWQKQATILNKFCGDSDIFEKAALSSRAAWNVIAKLETLPMHLKVPDSLKLPDSSRVLGNGIGVAKDTYNAAMSMLASESHTIDPVIFNKYTTTANYNVVDRGSAKSLFYEFNLPWGQISLYSSIADESVDFPVYPKEFENSAVANYTTMPDMLYQYEPWQIYQGSGPRPGKFTFEFHRDMWTGDHRDGMANKLIRFCEANCYPEFNGSAVNVPYVSMYVAGNTLITGVMTDCNASWDGPIGLDGWYLHCTLTLSITEVSQQALNYHTVMNKPLIG